MIKANEITFSTVETYFVDQNDYGVERVVLTITNHSVATIEFFDVNGSVVVISGEAFKEFSALWRHGNPWPYDFNYGRKISAEY